MKRRLVVFSFLTVPMMASAQPADWQTVVGADLRFRLEMPAPAAKTTAAEKEKGQTGERVAWQSKRDDELFDFDYVDYDAGWYSTRDTKFMARELGRGEAEVTAGLAGPEGLVLRDLDDRALAPLQRALRSVARCRAPGHSLPNTHRFITVVTRWVSYKLG